MTHNKGKIESIIDAIFGNKKIFKRVMYSICGVGFLIVVTLNISFSCGSKQSGCHFEWNPAARIEVKKGG